MKSRLMHTYGMFSLFLSLALLGVAAVDPIGIAVMPILLSQKSPLVRSCVFLIGSFVALIGMGFVFSKGLGTLILQFETTHAWLVPAIETAAGIILLMVALYLFWHTRKRHYSAEPSQFIIRKLHLGNWQLFILGALIVTFQSIVDIVFVVAMVQVETLHLSTILQVVGIATYAISALLLQIAIVVAYIFTPPRQRTALFSTISDLTFRHTNRIVIAISTLLGGGLLFKGVLTIIQVITS